jgi:folate-dependent tRNA-U54 methylase TrmFO/GidA
VNAAQGAVIEAGINWAFSSPGDPVADAARMAALNKLSGEDRVVGLDVAAKKIAEVSLWAAEEYRKCIVSARVTTDGHHYAQCNGRAEAYRQLCDEMTKAAGLKPVNWDAIRTAVPRDGIYR